MASKKYDVNQQKFADKLFDAYPGLGSTAEDVFAKIASYDPTATQKIDKNQYIYLEWICSRILREKPREQDLYKIREDLENYALLARFDKFRASRTQTIFYKPYVDPRIDQYSITTLAATILPYEESIRDRKKSLADLENEQADAESESVILYDGSEGRIVVPLTMEASQYWGKGTKWCISATKSGNLFKEYENDGTMPILMFLPKGTREKFATNEHDKNVRDMMDKPLGGALLNTDSQEKKKSIEILASFMAQVFTSGQLRIDRIQDNEHIVRAFHEMALRAPGIYNAILTKTDPRHIPDFFSLSSVLEHSNKYTNPDTSDDSDAEEILSAFYSQPEFLVALISDPLFANIKQATIDRFHTETVKSAVSGIISDIMKVPKEGISGTPNEVLQEFEAKYDYAIKFNEDMKGHGHLLEMDIDALSINYLAKVPKEVWQDPDFSMKALRIVNFSIQTTLVTLPEAYQHHVVWEAALQECGGAFSDLNTLANLYKTSENVEALDYAPFVSLVEELYPEGLETESEVDIISTQMPRCDFTALLEKTIERHPEFFADVAPEKQTLPMAIAAVKHDPGSLADMAADLFKGKKRPPELTAAFNLLPINSIERAAVAHHFTEHKLV